MDIFASILLGVFGLAAGLLLPMTVQRIVDRKNRAKGTPPAPEKGFPLLLRILLCFLNTAVWALAGLWMYNAFSAVFASVLFTAAVVIGLIDLRIRLIPNELVLVLLVAGGAFQVAEYGFSALLGSLLCMLGMIALFALTALFVGFSKVGAGDVKLAGAMGFALGYPHTVTALMVLCAALLLYTLVGLLLRKLTLKSMLPYGPFMAGGMAVALLCAVFRIVPPFLVTL